jgi:hypothetical protein
MDNTTPDPKTTKRIAIAATVCWILFFALGALVDTIPSRIAISPASNLATMDEEELSIASYVLDPSSPNSSTDNANNLDNLKNRLMEWSMNMESRHWCFRLLICMTCYTPMNLAILSILAGIIGGGYFLNIRPKLRETGNHISTDILNNNVVAGIRGFLIFLTLFTLMHMIVDDPLKKFTQSQYFRISGLFSVISFIAVYYSCYKSERLPNR